MQYLFSPFVNHAHLAVDKVNEKIHVFCGYAGNSIKAEFYLGLFI